MSGDRDAFDASAEEKAAFLSGRSLPWWRAAILWIAVVLSPLSVASSVVLFCLSFFGSQRLDPTSTIALAIGSALVGFVAMKAHIGFPRTGSVPFSRLQVLSAFLRENFTFPARLLAYSMFTLSLLMLLAGFAAVLFRFGTQDWAFLGASSWLASVGFLFAASTLTRFARLDRKGSP